SFVVPEQLDVARRFPLAEAVRKLDFVAGDDVAVAAAEEFARDAPGGGEILDAARILAAEILGCPFQAFVPEEAQDELGVLRADGAVAVDDVAAAEDLDLHVAARAAALDQLVDELLHGEVPVA